MSEQDDVKLLRALAKNMAAEGEAYHIPGAKEDAAAIVSVLARLEAAEADAERLIDIYKNVDIGISLDISGHSDADLLIALRSAIDAARGK